MSTMSQYTEEALDKMQKRELFPIVLSLQKKKNLGQQRHPSGNA